MRPLLLHASSPSKVPGHRRVIHLDFASSPLPGGLYWFSEVSAEVALNSSSPAQNSPSTESMGCSLLHPVPSVPWSLLHLAPYCSALTCSSQSTAFPSSFSWIAICVIAAVGAAPCQCFSPGANQITSPGRISSIGPPQCCARPQPDVTISVCPSGCVCHAVRAPGSKVTWPLQPAPAPEPQIADRSELSP